MASTGQRPAEEAAGARTSGDPASTVVVTADDETYREIQRALVEHELRASARAGSIDDLQNADIDESSIIIFVCDVDAPRDLADLRRLHRELSSAIVVISPPATGTGVRRALDAGAHGLVFAPELRLTLATAVRAVAFGQTVVPRNLRTSVEKPVLSHRERQVLALVRKGLTNAEIAQSLYLAESTIKSHLSSLFRKVGVRSRREAVAAIIDLETLPDVVSTAGSANVGERPVA